MKKNIVIILAALVLCTACQSNSVHNSVDSSEPTSSTAPVESVSAAPDTTTEPAQSGEAQKTGEAPDVHTKEQTSSAETPEISETASDAFFKPGVWQCSEYYFYEFDGQGGATSDFDSSVGMPFEYDVIDRDSGELMFHLFAADDNTPATAKVISDTEIELTWDFGRTDRLVYVPGKTMNDIEAEFKHYFKPGTWRGAEGYYFFRDDATSGCTLNFELGIGVGFDYEVMSRSEGFVNFHMGAVDSSEGVVVSDLTEDSFTLTWEDGTKEKLVYVSSQPEDEFKFYTNEQLQQIALKYYQANNDGYTPQYCGVQSNDDGTATIQLYDLVEDHNSTAAWYTIDRVTLKGTDDTMNTDVDMSAYAD